MSEAVMDSLIEDYQPLEAGLTLPDPNDVHVLAAAIKGHCHAIITTNLRDFPEAALEPFGLEAQHPDDFIKCQFDLDTPSVVIAAKACRQRLRRPAKTPEEYLATLAAQSLPQTVARLSEFQSLL
jgi:PIN domain